MATPTAQATIDIAAPADLVYDLVSSVTEVPRWAAEVVECRWLDGVDRPVVGARFRGVNRYRNRRWATTCVVTAADPGRRFGFDVKVAGVTTAAWWYDITPTPEGCRVTEATRRVFPKLVVWLINRLGLGIADRDAHNQRNIDATLAQLKRYAEAQAAERTA